MRIRLDKIASCTANARVQRRVVLGPDIPARPGTVIAVRVLDEKRTYNQVEDLHGRLMTVHRGDVVAGVLGKREALRGYAGEVPESVRPGDILHLLNLGGVIGRCTSVSPQVGPPCRVEVLGVVLAFPELGRRVGAPASIDPGPVKPAATLDPLPPMVLLVGSCMHAGKTAAACALVREATDRGLTVGVAKVTGVALRRDVLEMLDHGATFATTFADAGLPSTCEGEVVPVARGCMNHVAKQRPDLMVVELGDGLMGRYGVRDILNDPQIRAATGAVILSATDPVAAWGGDLLLREIGLQSTVITGPATDNDSGRCAILDRVEAVVANARTQPSLLADAVLAKVGLLRRGLASPAALEAQA
ncbi:MAG: hypothetical protein EA397_11740 [Deltaproteobacteria bacterium]|nr:MAG: hypothetical protein EA397_11740 [Deltaproteobacteria bacterium]